MERFTPQRLVGDVNRWKLFNAIFIFILKDFMKFLPLKLACTVPVIVK